MRLSAHAARSAASQATHPRRCRVLCSAVATPPWLPVEMEYSALAAMDEEEGPMVGHHGEPGVDPALLSKLCRGEIPAIILRNALTPAACAAMVERLHSLDDEHVKLVGGDTKESAERFDVGTALGVLGGDREAFFADATKTHKLFATLFNRLPANPCDALYSALRRSRRPLGAWRSAHSEKLVVRCRCAARPVRREPV